MGKGRRNRENRSELRPYEALYAKARTQQRVANGLSIAAIVVTVLGLFLPAWSLSIMDGNIAASQYNAEELAALTPIVPIGRWALILIALGVLAASVLLWMRRPALSGIGAAVCAAGDAMLVYFAVVLGQVFAYDPLKQRGLAFGDLLLRYYVLLLPLVLLIVALVFGFLARKKREIASVMETAADTAPTVLLDDEAL